MRLPAGIGYAKGGVRRESSIPAMIANYQKETVATPPKRDRFSGTYRTAAVALLIFYGNEIDKVLHLYVFLIPILGISKLFLIIALIVSFSTNAFAGRWR